MASFLVNGWPARSIDAADRGLMYGDGVFRTLVPSTQAEFGLFSHELRPIHWSGPVGTVDLRLEPPFPVEFVLVGTLLTALTLAVLQLAFAVYVNVAPP